MEAEPTENKTTEEILAECEEIFNDYIKKLREHSDEPLNPPISSSDPREAFYESIERNDYPLKTLRAKQAKDDALDEYENEVKAGTHPLEAARKLRNKYKSLFT